MIGQVKQIRRRLASSYTAPLRRFRFGENRLALETTPNGKEQERSLRRDYHDFGGFDDFSSWRVSFVQRILQERRYFDRVQGPATQLPNESPRACVRPILFRVDEPNVGWRK